MRGVFTRARVWLAVPLLLGSVFAWQSQASGAPRQNTQKHSYVCVDHSNPQERAAAKEARKEARQNRVEGQSKVKYVDDNSRHCR